MYRNTRELTTVLKDVLRTRDDENFINTLVYAIDDILSLNDFNLLLERLREDIQI